MRNLKGQTFLSTVYDAALAVSYTVSEGSDPIQKGG